MSEGCWGDWRADICCEAVILESMLGTATPACPRDPAGVPKIPGSLKRASLNGSNWSNCLNDFRRTEEIGDTISYGMPTCFVCSAPSNVSHAEETWCQRICQRDSKRSKVMHAETQRQHRLAKQFAHHMLESLAKASFRNQQNKNLNPKKN